MPNAKDLVFKLRSLANEFRTDDAARELDALDRSLAATATQAGKSAREVKNAADDLDAPGFDRAAAEAETTARRMRAAAEDMAAGIRTGGQKIDAETDKIRADMAETGKEAGAELVGNIAEGIGSGTGSINDVVQGTLGGIVNMAASIPGPFAIAGAAAAAGLGILWGNIQAETEKAKERIQSLIDALEETSGVINKVAKERIFEQWRDSLRDQPDKLSRIRDAVQYLGIDAQTFRDALAGSEGAQRKIRDAVYDTRDGMQKVYAAQGYVTDEQQQAYDNSKLLLQELGKQNTALGVAYDWWSASNELQDTAVGKTQTQSEKLDALWRKARDYADEMDRATKDRTMNVTVRVNELNTSTWSMNDPRRQNTGR